MTSRLYRLPIYMILATAAVLVAADDPGGWTAAKWGMTDEQILQAVPAATRLDPPEKFNHARVHIPSFDLAGSRFHVYFIPGPAGQLDQVLLSAEPCDAGYDVLFQQLQELLVQKYGRPWSSAEGNTTEFQWSLKTTTITLSRTKNQAINIEFLHLQYSKKSADLDKM